VTQRGLKSQVGSCHIDSGEKKELEIIKERGDGFHARWRRYLELFFVILILKKIEGQKDSGQGGIREETSTEIWPGA
jgi:hypothetical protein